MTKKQQARQIDIANELGVSQSTVSMVLSGTSSESISQEVRERVLAAAHGIGYRMRQARSVPAKQSIGLLVSADTAFHQSDPYFSRYFTGIMRAVGQAGYRLAPSEIHSLDDFFAVVADRELAGVIGYALEDHLLPESPGPLPMVLLRTYTSRPVADTVLSHDAAGLYPAVRHLKELGHRRIAFFAMTPVMRNPMLVARQTSYRHAMEALGLPWQRALTALYPAREQTLEEIHRCADAALARWMALPEPPTGIVTTADIYALPLLQAAQRLGMAVPEQLSVVGYDNREICEQSSPLLTSVEQNLEAMAQLACQLLIERIQQSSLPFRHIGVGTRLVVRKSTTIPCR